MTDKGELIESVFNEAPGCAPLWSEPYPFKRLSGPGEVFIREGLEWMVLSSRITPGTNEIRTVVRRVASPFAREQPK